MYALSPIRKAFRKFILAVNGSRDVHVYLHEDSTVWDNIQTIRAYWILGPTEEIMDEKIVDIVKKYDDINHLSLENRGIFFQKFLKFFENMIPLQDSVDKHFGKVRTTYPTEFKAWRNYVTEFCHQSQFMIEQFHKHVSLVEIND